LTLHQLFDLSSMEHRHLLASYGAVLLLQLGYATWAFRSFFARKTR
jgi:hypothetical protein